MKNKLLIGVSALVLMGSVLVAPRLVNAFQGVPSQQGPNYTPERHEAMTQAFENGDYDSWKELMPGRGRVKEVVNEDNFSRFAEMHQLTVDGKTEQANDIREDLGLGLGRRGQRQGDGQGNCMGRWNENE